MSPKTGAIVALFDGSQNVQGELVAVSPATYKASKVVKVGDSAGDFTFKPNGEAYVLDLGAPGHGPGKVLAVQVGDGSVGELTTVPAYASVLAQG